MKKRALLFGGLLLLALSSLEAKPRFPFPSTPDEVGQNDRDLDDGIKEVQQELDATQAAIAIATSTVLPGSTNYIQNSTSSQSNSAFNISTGIVSSLNYTFLGLGRNRIINGDMILDQRVAWSTVTINSAAWTYGLDRWSGFGEAADGVFTMTRSTDSPPAGFTSYIHHVVTTADASVGVAQSYIVAQRIEGYNMRDFNFGTSAATVVTISFWVRASIVGTFGGGMLNSGVTRANTFSYTINTANTWEKKTATFLGDTSGTWLKKNNTGAYLMFDMGSGTNYENTPGSWGASYYYRSSGNSRLISTSAATMDLTGVQVEIGPVATAFEFTPFPLLLAQCQRYFEKSYDFEVFPGATTTVNATRMTAALLGATVPETGTVVYRVEKRTTPTVTLYSPTGVTGRWTWFSAAGVGTERATTVQSGGTGSRGFDVFQSVAAELWTQGHWTADAELP